MLLVAYLLGQVKAEDFVKAAKAAHRKAGHNDSCPVFCVTVWDDLYEETKAMHVQPR